MATSTSTNPAPQLAQPLKGQPKAGSVFEPKFDGHRMVVHKVGDELSIYSRTFKDQSGKLPHLEAAFRSIPFDFTLDGEVLAVDTFADVRGTTVPIPSFSGTQKVMGSGAARAAASTVKLHYVAFDLLACQGKDLTDVPDVLRRGALDMVVDLLRLHTDHVLIAPRWTQVDDWQDLMAEVVAAGGEGLMVKNPLSAYYPGKRPTNAWFKAKDVDTADVVITGFKPGESGWTGMVGSVLFGQYKNGILVARTDGSGNPSSVSGFDMAQRREFTENGDAYIGKVMEIKYFGRVGPERSLRHPQFVRLRDDKEPQECEWDD